MWYWYRNSVCLSVKFGIWSCTKSIWHLNNYFRCILSYCWRDSVKPLQYFCSSLPMSRLSHQHKLYFLSVRQRVLLSLLCFLLYIYNRIKHSSAQHQPSNNLPCPTMKSEYSWNLSLIASLSVQTVIVSHPQHHLHCCNYITLIVFRAINPLDSRGNYSATVNDVKLVHWPLMGGLLHFVQRGGASMGAVDGSAVTFGTARRGLGGAPAYPGPSSLYQM